MTTAGLSARATRNQLTQSPGPGNIADPPESAVVRPSWLVAIDFGGFVSVDFYRLELVTSQFSLEYIRSTVLHRGQLQEDILEFAYRNAASARHTKFPRQTPLALETMTCSLLEGQKVLNFFHTRHRNISMTTVHSTLPILKYRPPRRPYRKDGQPCLN